MKKNKIILSLLGVCTIIIVFSQDAVENTVSERQLIEDITQAPASDADIQQSLMEAIQSPPPNAPVFSADVNMPSQNSEKDLSLKPETSKEKISAVTSSTVKKIEISTTPPSIEEKELVEAPPGYKETVLPLEQIVDLAVKKAVEEIAVEKIKPPMTKAEEAVKAAAEAGITQPDRVIIMEDIEILRRKAEETRAKELLEKADNALRQRKYPEALEYYEEALSFFERYRKPETEILRQRAKAGKAECAYRQAISLQNINDIDNALNYARQAYVAGHPDAERLVRNLEWLKANPPIKPPPPAVPRIREIEYMEKREQVKQMLNKVRERIALREYDEANEILGKVLTMDPYNMEAIRLKEKIGKMRYSSVTLETEATRANMMADLRDTWNPRVYVFETPTIGVKAPSPKPKVVDQERARILKKLEEIIIPEIDFHQANIQEVIRFLQQQSVEQDSAEEARRGVNLILNLKAGAIPGAPEVVPEIPLITFKANYITLKEALKIVCSIAGLRYYVEGNTVMIVGKDVAVGEIQVRTYDVLPDVEQKISAVSAEVAPLTMAGPGAIAPSPFTPTPGATSGGIGADWKQFFEQLGVEWPRGSSIRYIRSLGKLVVANTEENLAKFESILAELNVIPSQIEIEAKFVEVLQDSASSLGLEVFLTDEWEVLQKKGSSLIPLSGRERISVAKNDTTGGFTKGLRFLTQLGPTQIIQDDVLRVTSYLTNPELALVLHALERTGNADLLSAPRVTTKAGQEAVIKVVTEYIYPTDFTVTPITGTDANGNTTIVGGVVEPSGFETREVGVILQVTPQVTPDGKMIDLNMIPQVVSDPEWHNYGSTYRNPDGSVQTLNMEQPFFHVRSVQTSVSIYNGATVVLGGMIKENRSTVDDKIPFLGDIPIIGRLFRSQYETTIKRNLMVFVTGRLVDPAGRALTKTGEAPTEITKAIGSSTPQ